MSRHHRWVRALYLWHRRLGAVAALLVLLAAVTGLLLNHSDRLHLDRRHLQAAWLLDWYGIGPVRVPPGWQAGGHWYTVVDGTLYRDDRALARARGNLRGALHLPEPGLDLLAFDHALLLLEPTGEIAEWIEPLPGPGGPVRGLARLEDGRPLLLTDAGAWAADAELLQWHPREIQEPPSAALSPSPLPAPLRARLARRIRGQALTLERVLLDLHSGRLFGAQGPWLMDGAAVLLVLLSLSGGLLWVRQAWLRRRHRRTASTLGRARPVQRG